MALGFYFDMTRCIGCRACQVACKDKNNVNVGVILRNAKTNEVGTFPKVKVYSYSASCNHCTNAACVENCPTKAMYKAEDGTVLHDPALCLGSACRVCAAVCPYGVPQLNPETDKTVKCDACAYLRAKGQNPACVDACPDRALDFGDLDELKAKYGADLVSALPVCPDGGTGANILIKAKECAKAEMGKEIPL